MTIFLRQSTASQEVLLGRFVDSTDGNTEKTGLTIANTDIKVWKTGATTLASKNSGGGTHIANGVYYCVLDATDTDTIGPVELHVHVATALYIKQVCTVLDEAVYDSLFGTAALITSGTGAGQLSVTGGIAQADAVKINGILTSSVSSIKAIIGSTDTLNFTGSGGTALVKVDVQDFGGSAGTFSLGRPEVNASHFGGTAGTFSAGRPEVNASHIAGALQQVPGTTGGLVTILWAGTASAATSDSVTITFTGDPTGMSLSVNSTPGLENRIIDSWDGVSVATVKPAWASTPSGTINARLDPFGARVVTNYATDDNLNTLQGTANTILQQTGTDGVVVRTQDRAGIRKNTALANFEILMTDSTNHNPHTGLTVAITRSIDGAAFATGTLGAVTEVAAGIYKFDWAAADLNGDIVTLRATASGADDLFVTIRTDP